MNQSASGILVRFGEVFLKKGRRRFFMDKLAGNLERALTRVRSDLKLTRPYGRYLAVPKEAGARIEAPMEVAQALAQVFGVVWAGPCEIVVAPTPDTLSDAVRKYATTHRRRSHRTFRIKTSRADKSYPLTSMECNRQLGGVVLEQLDDLTVNLDEPDITIGVDIRSAGTYIYGVGVDGVGGLPVGSNGRALLLLSGGIDSPVAGWMIQKRGVSLDALTFLSPPYTGPKAREKVITLGRRLSVSQRCLRLWICPLTPLQEKYRDGAPPEQLVLLYRRSMVRMANALAEREGHEAIVTGESLGQVASQTIPNLHCIGSVSDRPVLRPLVGYDKLETIRLARRIGTYDTSILPFDDCCTLFVPQHPELKGRPERLARMEERIDPQPLEAELLASAEVLELTP